MSGLKKIPRRQIEKAFLRAKGEVKAKNVTVVLVTEEYYEMAIDFIREYYRKSEPVSKALGIGWDEEQRKVWLGILKDELSIMFIHATNGDVLAIRVTQFVTKDKRIDLSTVKDPLYRQFLKFCIDGDAEADFFGHYGADEAFNFVAMAVKDDYRHQGLASEIFRTAVNMIKYIGHHPTFIKGEASSNFSGRIYAKYGFEELNEKLYDSYFVDGRILVQNTGVHKSLKQFGLKVL